jgi:hypothetical protein
VNGVMETPVNSGLRAMIAGAGVMVGFGAARVIDINLRNTASDAGRHRSPIIVVMSS